MGSTVEPGTEPTAGAEPGAAAAADRVPLPVIAREWVRIGCIGFGGPPAHISLLRKLCVDRRRWLSTDEFEDGVATTNLLPGPASTQLAIFCAWRLGGPAGAIVGGACFIVPGLIVILALSALFLATHPPLWVEGAAAGAGSAVPAVALQAAFSLGPASWRRATGQPGAAAQAPAEAKAESGADQPRPARRLVVPRWSGVRWIAYLAAGGVAGALTGPFLVFVLAACGAIELVVRSRSIRLQKNGNQKDPDQKNRDQKNASRVKRTNSGPVAALLPVAIAAPTAVGGLLAVAWVAFKVGALSYGGGFVIIPLMQHDVVHTYHWMT
ncbi:MAG TPA: chromate transporter, partial [Streptosporangiaceae bacterium]|nr:chromate transporter [Streptosporangiaceae bacterium]